MNVRSIPVTSSSTNQYKISYFLRPLVSGSSAQKAQAAPFSCFSRGESNPRCSSIVRAPRYIFANKHCGISDNVHPCCERLVLRNARSIFWRFFSNSTTRSLLISSQSALNSSHSSHWTSESLVRSSVQPDGSFPNQRLRAQTLTWREFPNNLNEHDRGNGGTP